MSAVGLRQGGGCAIAHPKRVYTRWPREVTVEIAILRLLHIGFGAFWVGGAVMTAWWVVPSVIEAGPSGGPVMRGIVEKRKLPVVMTVAGLITILAGLRLYMIKFSTAWLTTPEGIVLSLGGLLAIAGYAIGMMVQRPTAMKLAALGGAIAAAGKPPTPEQAAEVAALQQKLARAARLVGAHVLAALVLMAAMRLAQQLST